MAEVCGSAERPSHVSVHLSAVHHATRRWQFASWDGAALRRRCPDVDPSPVCGSALALAIADSPDRSRGTSQRASDDARSSRPSSDTRLPDLPRRRRRVRRHGAVPIAMILWVRTPYVTHQFDQVDPASGHRPLRHRVRDERDRPALYCHFEAARSPYRRGVPPTSTCMNCHSRGVTSRVRSSFAPVRASWFRGRTPFDGSVSPSSGVRLLRPLGARLPWRPVASGERTMGGWARRRDAAGLRGQLRS